MHVAGPFIGFFGLVWVALPVLIALLIVWAGRSQPRYAPPPPPAAPQPETPLEILARRFASGEISADEYQKARDLLQGGTPPAAAN